jgi:hypothetical protein
VLGTTTAAKHVLLLGTGTGPLEVTSVIGTAPISQTNNCSTSLAPLAFCTIQVSFTPTFVGPVTGSLAIVDNAGTQTVNLSGNGTAPVILFPGSLNFHTVAVGSTSAVKTVFLKNHLTVALSFTSIVASAGFAIASNTCGASIAAGAS